MTGVTIKRHDTADVAVTTAYYWQPMTTCPLGVKVQLKTTPGGVAVYGQVSNSNRSGFQGWAPLPATRK